MTTPRARYESFSFTTETQRAQRKSLNVALKMDRNEELRGFADYSLIVFWAFKNRFLKYIHFYFLCVLCASVVKKSLLRDAEGFAAYPKYIGQGSINSRGKGKEIDNHFYVTDDNRK